MHNKSFTSDNQVSVVGGRNIGNEYFGAGAGVVFADLDVIAVGAAVPDVAKEFDIYWNSPSAYPAASFVGAPNDAGAALKAKFVATRADPDARGYKRRCGPRRWCATSSPQARVRVDDGATGPRRPGEDAGHRGGGPTYCCFPELMRDDRPARAARSI